MSVFDNSAFRHHESVHFFSDEATGLRAIVAIHTTDLGPALGGCRMVRYQDSSEALTDVLRLSRGMSLKNSLAGLDLGGGKAVIMVPEGWNNDPKYQGPERERLFEAFGRCVETLGGRYITAEDMNVSVKDAESIARGTKHVVGLDSGMGDPSPLTAKGVFGGIRGCVQHAFDQNDFNGLTVAVQGLGKVGWRVCEQLHRNGAKLIVADIDEDTLQRAVKQFDAEIADPVGIVTAECDVFVPCARGGIITNEILPDFKAKVIAGAANNQLLTDDLGQKLHDAGIIYAPDYVINAGGVINIFPEVQGKVDHRWVDDKVAGIEATVNQIVDQSLSQNRPTSEVADDIAFSRILAAREGASVAA